jgi:hypothetical protein
VSFEPELWETGAPVRASQGEPGEEHEADEGVEVEAYW